MLRRVAGGRGKALSRGYSRHRSRRVSALGTELGYRGKRTAAVRARAGQRRRTVLAELGAYLIVVLAPGTLHVSPGPARVTPPLGARTACPSRGTSSSRC